MYTSYYMNGNLKIPNIQSNALSTIKYMVIDIDGTLTDGGIYYDEQGNEFKKFNTKDAAGFFTAKACGIFTVVITGRRCQATERRMKEMQVDLLEQGIVDKVGYLKKFIGDRKINYNELAYMGDDLNDYMGMELAGFKACPSDAADEIKEIVDYISTKKGGEGAFRDVMQYILRQRGQWEQAYKNCYHII